MSFNTLTPELQNILLANHSYITKWFVFLIIIFLSYYYISIIWKEHTPTKYITTVFLRLFLASFSIIYLLLSPLTIILMSPEYSFLDFYLIPSIIYSIITTIIFITLFFDGLKYGILGLLKLGGLDIRDSNVRELMRQFENNKHFLKKNNWKK